MQTPSSIPVIASFLRTFIQSVADGDSEQKKSMYEPSVWLTHSTMYSYAGLAQFELQNVPLKLSFE